MKSQGRAAVGLERSDDSMAQGAAGALPLSPGALAGTAAVFVQGVFPGLSEMPSFLSLLSLRSEQDCVLMPSQCREEASREAVADEGEGPFSLFFFLLNMRMLERATSGTGWGECLGMWPAECP